MRPPAPGCERTSANAAERGDGWKVSPLEAPQRPRGICRWEKTASEGCLRFRETTRRTGGNAVGKDEISRKHRRTAEPVGIRRPFEIAPARS